MSFGKSITVPLLLFSLLPSARLTAIPLQELLNAAAAARQGISINRMDMDLSILRRRKAEIEARTETERLGAEFALVAAEGEYRKTALVILNEVIDTVFTAAVAEVDASIAKLKLDNTAEGKRLADSKYRSGLLSVEGFRTAELALRTSATDHALALWSLKDAKDSVIFHLGREWGPSLLPDIPEAAPEGTAGLWMEQDTTVRRARLSEKIAVLKLADLPSNAAAFDRKILEAELAKARVTVVNAESTARRAFDGITGRLENQKSILQIRREEGKLSTTSSKDAQKRYEAGLISLGELHIQRIADLTGQKNILLAWRSYMKTLGEYSAALGADPTGTR